MTIRVYNTLTKSKEDFQTIEPGKVGIYLCGPTVYKEAHIGHMVGPVIFDTIKRYLAYCGYDVTWVVNITDVDDKLIAESQRRGISMQQVATEMTADYIANLTAMGVDQIDLMPKATDHIGEIIGFIEELIERKYAYASDGDVFFEVGADPQYGQLSNRTVDSMQGVGGEAAGKKRSPADFALWKAAKPGEPSWSSPWGEGRPGWHIECSAMSRKLLGKTFDIHGGGLDLVFPHHENELAQSNCCHGQPMVRYWLHNGLMRAGVAGKVGGRGEREADPQQASAETKLSRSKGAGGLAELIDRHGGPRIRFFLLRTHYRSTIVFNEEGLEEAGAALETFARYFERFERIAGRSFYDLPTITRREQGEIEASNDPLLAQVTDHRASFLAKMDDDFNSGAAVSDLFELVRTLNKFVDAEQLEEATNRDQDKLAGLVRGTTTLRELLTGILGLFNTAPATATGQDQGMVDDLMQLLLELRTAARQSKDFATADKIRNRLTELGVTIEDRKDGTLWRVG